MTPGPDPLIVAARGVVHAEQGAQCVRTDPKAAPKGTGTSLWCDTHDSRWMATWDRCEAQEAAYALAEAIVMVVGPLIRGEEARQWERAAADGMAMQTASVRKITAERIAQAIEDRRDSMTAKSDRSNLWAEGMEDAAVIARKHADG
jgi:hypothetical protein